MISSTIQCERPADLDLTVDNPRGYFESTLLRPFNDALLAQAGFAWDRPPLAPVYWQQGHFLLSAIQRKKDFSAYALTDGWVDKDPRLSLTYPLFEHLLLRRVPCVIVIRHPLEVASSLHWRDGFSHEKGLLIWFLYNRSASHFFQAQQDQLLCYERLLGGDPGQLRKLQCFLLPWAQRSGLGREALEQRIRKAHQDLSDRALRRNTANDSCQGNHGLDAGHPLLKHCLALYASLSFDSNESADHFSDGFAEIPSWLIDHYDRIMQEGQPSLEFLRLHDVKPHGVEAMALSSDLQTGQYQRDQRIIEDFASLLEAVHALRQEVGQVDRASQQLHQKEERIRELELQLHALHRSSSWRLTAPLRSLVALLRRSLTS